MWRLYRNLKMQKQKWASFVNATGGGVATGGRVDAGGRQTAWGWCFWRGQVLGRGRVEMEGTRPHRGDHEEGAMCIHSVDGGGRQTETPACRRGDLPEVDREPPLWLWGTGSLRIYAWRTCLLSVKTVEKLFQICRCSEVTPLTHCSEKRNCTDYSNQFRTEFTESASYQKTAVNTETT